LIKDKKTPIHFIIEIRSPIYKSSLHVAAQYAEKLKGL